MDMIKIGDILVSRETEVFGYAPVKIGFRFPITDESLRSLAVFANGLAKGEQETMRRLGIEPNEG